MAAEAALEGIDLHIKVARDRESIHKSVTTIETKKTSERVFF